MGIAKHVNAFTLIHRHLTTALSTGESLNQTLYAADCFPS
jgi:hypothetical protein